MRSTNSAAKCLVSDAVEKFGAEAEGQCVFVGYSGGIDSQSLLFALSLIRMKYRIKLAAVHVNHQESKQANLWEQHCKETCTTLNVEFIAHRLDVINKNTKGKEAELRDARYSWFESLLGKTDILVTAHHLDDHVETIFLRLMRGSGVGGLRGIPFYRAIGQGALRRPFRDIWRKDIVAYANYHRLNWIVDDSNSDEAFDRNFVRHNVIVQLSNRWPGCSEAIARSSEHLMAADRLMDGVGAEDLAQIYKHATECRFANFGKIDVPQFNLLSIERRNNLLRYWVKSFRDEPPGHRKLSELCRQLVNSVLDSKIQMVFGAVEFRSYRNYLYLLPRQLKPVRVAPQVWKTNQSFELAQTGIRIAVYPRVGIGLSASVFDSNRVVIGWYSRSIAFRFHKRGSTRNLRNICQEKGIPPWERWRLPVIFYEDSPVYVPGIGIAPDFAARKGDNGVEFVLEESI